MYYTENIHVVIYTLQKFYFHDMLIFKIESLYFWIFHPFLNTLMENGLTVVNVSFCDDLGVRQIQRNLLCKATYFFKEFLP